jgi:prolyl-tRNA synthetase
MRGREFIMKDAYSFDLDSSAADGAYEKMYTAYQNIFRRCGLNFRAVEADTGNIGGSSSHEFMVLADSGEDAIVSCDTCDYAANVEKAQLRVLEGQRPEPAQELEAVNTPEQKSVAEVAQFLGIEPKQMLKTLLLESDSGEQVAVLLRGDRELNEIKLCRKLGCNEVKLVDDATVENLTGAPRGFAGPVGLKLRILADNEVALMADAVAGANKADTHYRGVNYGRDFEVDEFADLRQAEAGDGCPRCNGTLQSWRGIEVGHVFKLGTKYSEALGATVLNAEGKEEPLVMGCYGIGIGRSVAAAIEQNHDKNGIIFPMPIAPFQVLITLLNPKDDEVSKAGEELYAYLQDNGIEVLLDDRDERPGSKFKDADLIGIPLRVTVGARGLKEDTFEVSWRKDGEKQMIPIAETGEWLVQWVKDAMQGKR